MKKSRVVVVGGGVIGLCTAYYALRKGMEVTLVDRGKPGIDNCSARNAGMIVPSHFIPLAAPGMVAKGLRWILNPKSPFYVRPSLNPDLMRWGWLFLRYANARHVEHSVELLRDLNLESRRLFEELTADEDFGLVKRGLLMLCKSGKGLEAEAEVADMARLLGIQAEVLDAKQTAMVDPSVTMNIAGAVHFPQDCHLDPQRFLESITRRVLSMGGTIHQEIEIDRIIRTPDKITAVEGSGQRFEGDQFVICGGSWTSKLLRNVGLRLPLQPGKGYSLTIDSPPQLPQLCSILSEAKVAVTPMDGRLRIAGTMEVGSMGTHVNRNRVEGIIHSIVDYFPVFDGVDFSSIEPWAGLRPVSPDGIPYLGNAPHIENLFISTGHAMMGLSLGPVSGRAMADLLTGETPFRDLAGMAVNRF
ncbi:FAD-dependent oxidoreductase [Luteolibacter pohnpeiensis]|uniref:FAD-dependent oxidoreductase n=1 Tax=Luteolibacter pohnpeiensis TaxID=454153 RepID=A0A934VT15_9BACT|nr:FAD-dependent oxidoreductase [Luteolibacter pohnpeiensis]MBK1881017.1 FAD-dependent oxidoreductase [Luteolibacter pohnpeiensis]